VCYSVTIAKAKQKIRILNVGHKTMRDKQKMVLAPNTEIILDSGVDLLLSTIRPHWQARNLISRVKRLLPTDASSACQRIFNASIHDLKEKLCLAGIDIVAEVAKLNKLPPVSRPEDIEQYSPYNTIELAYRVGLLSRPEARRLYRVYEIRGDLEHEDDEYEATIEDCIYVFKTCIECVLSRDPIEIICLLDIKNIVEQPSAVNLGDAVVQDFLHAPDIRQLEIHRFLVSNALNKDVPDIVRQNCYTALQSLREHTHNQVLIESSRDFVKRIGRNPPDLLHARVAFAAGIFPYLKKVQIAEFFKAFLDQMGNTGFSFRSHAQHGDLLRNLKEVGGLEFVPDELKPAYLEWLILCYIGEPGGYGMGYSRKVFYSNVGAPLALDLIKDHIELLRAAFDHLKKNSKKIRAELGNQHVARRFESISDLFDQ
jgi:hypothetical protein